MSTTEQAKLVPSTVKIAHAKGRPMLSWVGTRPLREVRTYPAQEIQRFAIEGPTSGLVDWSDWPARFERGGLLFRGDNKEVLAYLPGQWLPRKTLVGLPAGAQSCGPDHRHARR